MTPTLETVTQQANPQQYSPEPLQIPGLGLVQARSMVIASVHFETRTERFHHSGRRLFVLPAAEKGKYTTLKFYDSQQAVRNTSDPDNSVAEYIPMPVPVEEIAKDLIANWTRTGIDVAAQSARPSAGIMIIAGEVPTAAELAQMNRMEERLCRSGVEEGDRITKTGKGVIGDFHRSCLSWLGSERREWFRAIEQGSMKVSAITGNRINMMALADGGDLLEYYVKYDLDPLNYGDEHVARMFKDRPDMRKQIAARLGLSKQGSN